MSNGEAVEFLQRRHRCWLWRVWNEGTWDLNFPQNLVLLRSSCNSVLFLQLRKNSFVPCARPEWPDCAVWFYQAGRIRRKSGPSWNFFSDSELAIKEGGWGQLSKWASHDAHERWSVVFPRLRLVLIQQRAKCWYGLNDATNYKSASPGASVTTLKLISAFDVVPMDTTIIPLTVLITMKSTIEDYENDICHHHFRQ